MDSFLPNRWKLLCSLALLAPGAYSLGTRKGDASFISDAPIISSPFFATDFEYNETEWYYIEPKRSLWGYKTSLLQNKPTPKRLKEKRDQKFPFRLSKRIPSEESEHPFSQEPSVQGENDPQPLEDDEIPAWADIQSLQVPRDGEYTQRILYCSSTNRKRQNLRCNMFKVDQILRRATNQSKITTPGIEQ